MATKTTGKFKRKCKKAVKKKRVKKQLNIDIENVRMGRSSGDESDLNDEDDDEDRQMLEPPPGKFFVFNIWNYELIRYDCLRYPVFEE